MSVRTSSPPTSNRLDRVLAVGFARALRDGSLDTGTTPKPQSNAGLNRFGPQSTRPLPRWYWWSDQQKRWRRFDNAETGMLRNDTLEKLSEKKGGGLQPGMVIKWPANASNSKQPGIRVVSWNQSERRGTFSFKDDGSKFTFERLSQREAIEVQGNNFVYDHSGIENPADSMLADFAHVVPMFKDMLERELKFAKKHVFMYHSYHNVSLIYDLGACLMRVAFPKEVNAWPENPNRDSIVLRADRSTFNNRSPKAVVANFKDWYNNTDVFAFNDETRRFSWIGVSTVLNCFKPNPESTVVHDFKEGYNPGDSPDLNPVLDELLESFFLQADKDAEEQEEQKAKIKTLKDKLLQLTIEADVDVTSFMGGKIAHLFFRRDATQPWTVPKIAEKGVLEVYFKSFMKHDNELGPEQVSAHGFKITLMRDKPGMQAHGTAINLKSGEKFQVLTVTKNPGRYLQLAIPLTLVDQLAYAAMPFGIPDTYGPHALSKIDERTDLTSGGQTRLIARPDLIWHKDVKQKVYQFSRAAEEKRVGYLEKMEALLREELKDEGKLRVARKLRPAPIVVRSHNVKHDNTESGKLVDALLSAIEKYSFVCLQEATKAMLTKLEAKLPASHTLMYAHACGAKLVYAAMVYHSKRFELKGGGPYYGCFKLTKTGPDAGRPVVGAVFDDTWVGRRVLVLSIHAPHNNYSLSKNLQFFVEQTLKKSGVSWKPDVAHVVIAGDFNRDDWGKPRSLSLSSEPVVTLRSAQNANDLKATLPANKQHSAIDNILFASRRFRYQLELTTFYADADKHGSDHKAVVAKFLC